MSVGTHIAEVARQGIWASLTGGWYYEPGCSIFCNTVHVYVWFLLMLLPLALGIFASGTVNVALSMAYTGIIVFLFTIIKVIISYMHLIFDTTDPIVVTRTINDSTDDMFRDSEQQPLDIEMIELAGMQTNRGALDRADRRDRDVWSHAEPSGPRRVRYVHESLIEEEEEAQKSPKNKEVEGNGEKSDEEDFVFTANEVIRKPKRKNSEPVLQSSDADVENSPRRGSDTNVAYGIDKKDQEGSSKKEEPYKIAEQTDSPQSMFEARDEFGETVSPVKRVSRRRSSTASAGRKKKRNSRAGSPAVFAGSLVKRGSQESSRSMPTSVGWTPVVVSLGDNSDRPTTSRYSADDSEIGSDLKGEITKFLEELIDKHPETLDAIENVRMSRLGRTGRPSSSGSQTESTVSENVPAPLRQQTDAVERVTHGIFGVPHVLRNAARRSGQFIDWHAHQQVASTSQHHIAQDHADTSQGAVHSFEDEDGTWWTYAFDENGVGTAQPLGSGRAVMELLQREREKHGESVAKKLFPVELEVLPESMYDSTEDEKEQGDKDESEASEHSDESEEEKEKEDSGIDERHEIEQMPSTSQQGIQLTRRERALSSSSNDSCTYLPPLPSNVFHAPSGAAASRIGISRGSVNFSSAATRFREMFRQESGNDDNWQVNQILSLIENNQMQRTSQRDRGESLPLTNDRLVIASMDGATTSSGPSRLRLLSDILFNSQPPVSTPDFNPNRRTSSNVRKSYYYQMKMFPKVQRSFNLKLDRPSVDRLFDRNRCVWSLLFDILLAVIVSILAVFVISTNIFYDYGLVVFAIVVASSHFSLLKSVQPDAASPIHGFNWIVAYNRPIYFCILSSILLFLHYWSGGSAANEIVAWNWNPFRFSLMTWQAVFLAMRDIVSVGILLLPVAFTLGWLPQVNTLGHHILEQVEMHLFGGTASFGVFSAFVQISKSFVVYAALCALCRLSFTFASTSTQSPLFSMFVSITIALSYLLSRMSSNQQLTVILFEILTSPCRKNRKTPVEGSRNCAEEGSPRADTLQEEIRKTITERARYDLLFSIFLILFFFGLHSTSLFTSTQPYFTQISAGFCVVFGVLNHYLYPKFRSHTPWRLVSQPVLRSAEYSQFESPDAAKLMVFEIVHMWMVAIERNVLYPLFVTSLITENNWNLPYAWVLFPLISMRLLRGGFAQPQLMFIPIAFSCISTAIDFKNLPLFGLLENSFGKPLTSWNFLPIIAYICVVIYPKFVELYLKANFVFAYVAPWQISWGSAFHAFAQPFSVPHSALIAIQTIISSIISAPLNPFLGSSFFTCSYVRPVKFWERDYNTKRSDASNTRLASQIERGPMMDDSNLNAVFYEHLTRSLQKSLAGDLAMGRWSTSVQPGDCFILASFYLNCLVHIIEIGNGFVTFQLRGLEFRGTYCHQREVEAISEDIRDGNGCCCCAPGSLPGLLSLNTAWGLKWLAWEVVSGKYIIDGYSISDNSAVNLLQVHELRRLLVTLYVKCIIYYATTSNKLAQWLEEEPILTSIIAVHDPQKYTDMDSMFCSTNDEDYDSSEGGISKKSYIDYYENWIAHCLTKRAQAHPEENIKRGHATIFTYMASLVARRSLGTAAFNRHSNAAESFLYGLHSLFKGDFRITCQRDEWVFSDMDILRCVVAPAVKMALKLHQDHFAHYDAFDDVELFYNSIEVHQRRMFISHEQDPGWRSAILSNTTSLLALRHVYDDGQDDYKIIMLNKMHLNMRVIKLNRECVRAFWSGQQQELIFLRNRNPERGSIQNARQVLRNMINSSADQPVGYPIYVSPLTTSHIESHSQIKSIFGPTFTYDGFRNFGRRIWNELSSHFEPSGSSSARQSSQPPLSQQPQQGQQQSSSNVPPVPPQRAVFHIGPPTPMSTIREVDSDQEIDDEVAAITASAIANASKPLENSIVEMTRDGARVTLQRREVVEPIGQTSIEREKILLSRPNLASMLRSGNIMHDNRYACIGAWVQLLDPEQIFKYLNEPLKSTGECLVVWPDEFLQHMSGRSSWMYQPVPGMCGRIVWTWFPNHPNRTKRSHVGESIHLVAIPTLMNGLVPIGEKGLRLLTASECAIQGFIGTTAEEFQTRFIDALILAKIITGQVSARTQSRKPHSNSTPTPSTSGSTGADNQPSTSSLP